MKTIDIKRRAEAEGINMELLNDCIEVAEDCFGFFTDRYPRAWEYTWLLKMIQGVKGNVLDIGTGMSPLPIILARTAKVITLDSLPELNKVWGFGDYSEHSKNIESKNIDIADFKTRKRFSAIYSISALEHMPEATYTAAIEKSAKYLKKDGIFLATIDLQKGTDMLWNKSYGKIIEDDHGTIDSLLSILNDNFSQVDHRVQYNIRGVATDLLYVMCKK